MQTTIFILLTLSIIALATKRHKPAWFQQLQGGHKLIGVIAVVLALLILLNPDLLALGLFADTTFFDMLVLALSLKILMYFQWAGQSLRSGIIKFMRWAGIPSPGMFLLHAGFITTIAFVTTTVQKVLHRISS